MNVTAKAPIKNDPERRQRIIDATASIIGSRGIGAVTFRSVASEAKVPLGSTTYYFPTKDQLLIATIRDLRARSDEHFEKVLAEQVHKHGTAEGVARMVEYVTTEWRESLLIGYGVYVSSFSQQSLRDVAADWTLDKLLGKHCPAPGGKYLSIFIEGVLAQVVLSQRQFTAAELLPAITRLMNER